MVLKTNPFLAGVHDGWTSRHGGHLIRELRKVRIICWARVAEIEDQEDSGGLPYFWGKSVRPPGCWSRLPKEARDDYTQGRKAPQHRTVEKVGLYAPQSQQVYLSRLWTALHPQTDLSTCSALLKALGGEAEVQQAEAIFASLDLAGVARTTTDFETLTRLILAIRLAKAVRDDGSAYRLGTVVIKLLGFITAHRLLASCLEELSDIVGKLVLNGLDDGTHQIHLRRSLFRSFEAAVSERLFAAESLGGGLYRMTRGPRLTHASRIDIVLPFVRELGTPGIEAYDKLRDLLENSMPSSLVPRPSSRWSDVLKELERYMLFEPVGTRPELAAQ